MVVGRDVAAAGARIARDIVAGATGEDTQESRRNLDMPVRHGTRPTDEAVRWRLRAARDGHRMRRELAVAGEDAVGLVVVDARNDAALVGALAEHEPVALLHRVIRVRDAVVRGKLGTLVILAGDDVDDAADRIRTVD